MLYQKAARRTSPGATMHAPLYILTDARGFTTCCGAGPSYLNDELSRISLLPPITRYHWARVNGFGPYNGWKLMATKTSADGVTW